MLHLRRSGGIHSSWRAGRVTSIAARCAGAERRANPPQVLKGGRPRKLGRPETTRVDGVSYRAPALQTAYRVLYSRAARTCMHPLSDSGRVRVLVMRLCVCVRASICACIRAPPHPSAKRAAASLIRAHPDAPSRHTVTPSHHRTVANTRTQTNAHTHSHSCTEADSIVEQRNEQTDLSYIWIRALNRAPTYRRVAQAGAQQQELQ